MKTVIFTGFLASMLFLAEAYPNDFDHIDTWNIDRRRDCVPSMGKCYASGQCCKGYVCAASGDDFYVIGNHLEQGLNPDIPGYCVKEKDLKPCESYHQCPSDKRCSALGHTSGRFCVERPSALEELENAIAADSGFNRPSEGQGLGFPCEDDSDCAAHTKDGKHKLCCQKVRRYRQKAKQMCDRVTAISTCMGKKKK